MMLPLRGLPGYLSFAAAVVAFGCCGSPARSSGLVGACRTYQPIEAMDEHLGSKSALAYFVSEGGACSVVVMVSEKFDADGATPATSAARVRLALPPGRSISLDSEEGSLKIECGRNAEVMHVATSPRDQDVSFAMCGWDSAE